MARWQVLHIPCPVMRWLFLLLFLSLWSRFFQWPTNIHPGNDATRVAEGYLRQRKDILRWRLEREKVLVQYKIPTYFRLHKHSVPRCVLIKFLWRRWIRSTFCKTTANQQQTKSAEEEMESISSSPLQLLPACWLFGDLDPIWRPKAAVRLWARSEHFIEILLSREEESKREGREWVWNLGRK